MQVLGDQFDDAQLADLISAVERLGGRLDGGHDRIRVFTIPVEAGFPAVEATFARFTSEHSLRVVFRKCLQRSRRLDTAQLVAIAPRDGGLAQPLVAPARSSVL